MIRNMNNNYDMNNQNNNLNNQFNVQNNGQNGFNTNNPNNLKSEKNKMNPILIIIIVIVGLFIIGKLFSGNSSSLNNNFYNNTSSQNNSSENSSNNSNNQTVQATIDIHDFEGYATGTTYKSYVGKRITITNIPVKFIYDSYNIGTMGVGIRCDNESSLNLSDNSTISITGTISNSTSSDSIIKMTDCSIN